MKNRYIHIIYIMAAFCMLALTSCVKEGEVEAPQEMATAVYNIAFYDYEIKSLGDASDIYIWYAVYNEDGSLFYECEAPAEILGGNAECPVTLILEKSYRVVFLGMHYDENMNPSYAIDAANGLVRQPEHPYANSDKGDLFYTYDDVNSYDGNVSDGVSLERISAQVNFICNAADWTSAQQKPTASSLELSGVPAAYSLLEGKAASGSGNVTYPRTALPAESDLKMNEGYVVFSAYTFAAEAPQTTKASAVLKMWNDGSLGAEDYLINVSGMDLQGNKKTNIQGDIVSKGKK